LTRAADYALRVMIHLATLPAGQRALLPALACATEAPKSFLSKILQALCRAGFIASQRGQSGGFQILAPGRQASIRAVIEAIDGPISLNLCLISGASCKSQLSLPGAPRLGSCSGGDAGGAEHGDRRRTGAGQSSTPPFRPAPLVQLERQF
jgi:Rrf2 family protein